jgi:hypothetical protein
MGLGYFICKHLDEETLGFAADISRKLPRSAVTRTLVPCWLNSVGGAAP